MKRVMVVYGTRPEAIKFAPVIQAMEADAVVEPVVVVTGQHRSMLDQVNDFFGIRPEYDLDIISPGQTLEDVTSRTLAGLREVVGAEKPDAIVVQGDTTTTFASALSAYYNRVPLVHLEAGLRTGDIYSPYPEEMNRRLVSRLAALHLAPTAACALNLLREGIGPAAIIITGNTVIDALLTVAARHPPYEDPLFEVLDGDPRRMMLVTTHRRESWGAPMVRVGEAIATLSRRYPELLIVAPLHRNPLVREALLPLLSPLPNVLISEPASYPDFVRLMERSTLILTDSGGVQEEGPSLGKPVLVLRDNTERPEAVSAGTARLVGTDPQRIEREVARLLNDPIAYAEMAHATNPYGDGAAADRTIRSLHHMFGLAPAPEPFAPPGTIALEGNRPQVRA
jgi:UDP-N-acetylglucosamine 2-epimerase (non-hydrolysing)